MGVDKSYGSGYKRTGKADPTVGTKGKRKASGAERSRAKDLKSGALGRPAGSSPFNNVKGKAIGWDEVAGVAATVGLAAAGIAGLRSVRGSVIKRNAAQRTSISNSKFNALISMRPAIAAQNVRANRATRNAAISIENPEVGRALRKPLPNNLGRGRANEMPNPSELYPGERDAIIKSMEKYRIFDSSKFPAFKDLKKRGR